MAVGRLSTVVLEARDPRELARFYSRLLGVPIIDEDGDWVDIGESGGARLSFQLAPEHQPPRWPDPVSSMQFHLDIDVADIEVAEAEALALGATRLDAEPAGSQAGGSESAGSQAGGSEAGGSESAGSQAGGSESAGSQAGGEPRPASGFRVYADPAGHPFCLCWG